MFFKNLIVISILSVFLWILALPILSLLFRDKPFVYRRDIAKKNVKFSAAITIIAIFHLLNFSFSDELLADIAGIIMVLMFVKLAVSALHLNQKIIGIAIGASSLIFGALFIIIFFALSKISFNDKSEIREIPNKSSTYCRKYSNDFGEGMHVFKRYIIVDKMLIPKNKFGQHYDSLSEEDVRLLESCYDVF
jgi:hypothetical protein